jgi:hypothetical protein
MLHRLAGGQAVETTNSAGLTENVIERILRARGLPFFGSGLLLGYGLVE